ncbi:hypothetical protein ACIQNU_29775 [Streptomyces sp. NPDC091292]|uniref:hypothetical protein n=1 Tax=Streptomyces sp. NPDC091292 TaxID=3365991 RepID=UPI0038110FF2
MTAAALLASSGTALADKGDGNSRGGEATPTGNRSGNDISSQITYSGQTRGSGKSSRPVTPVSDWTPPACWYEPRTAQQFSQSTEAGYEETINTPGQHSYAKRAVGEFREDYKDGTYKNYNLDIADEGNFWVPVRDPDRWTDPEAQACNRLPFWVENGDPPNVPNAVTPEILAALAYNQIELPNTEVTLAPENVTKVNLPTWAWLDKAKFKPVSVTARLAIGGLNIEATTTATPRSLKLEPGTSDAKLHPGSGECGFGADGSIGTPYQRGDAGKTPPCGLTYLRSSGADAYQLKATVTWDISWTGTGNPNATNLPAGTFGTEQAITVEEIQSINR